MGFIVVVYTFGGTDDHYLSHKLQAQLKEMEVKYQQQTKKLQAEWEGKMAEANKNKDRRSNKSPCHTS